MIQLPSFKRRLRIPALSVDKLTLQYVVSTVLIPASAGKSTGFKESRIGTSLDRTSRASSSALSVDLENRSGNAASSREMRNFECNFEQKGFASVDEAFPGIVKVLQGVGKRLFFCANFL